MIMKLPDYIWSCKCNGIKRFVVNINCGIEVKTIYGVGKIAGVERYLHDKSDPVYWIEYKHVDPLLCGRFAVMSLKYIDFMD